MRSYLIDALAISSALLLLCIFASYHPWANFAQFPSYWVDEAVSVEKARNFLEEGRLDIAIAPGIFSEKPYATAAAGPLLTVPLAGFFSVAGIGIPQVRFFMFGWLVILVVAAYFFVRAIADRKAAYTAILLIATFAPLYANGKTATGDIPGFVALLTALYALLVRKWYGAAGILFAIAATTKPSLYLPVAGIAVLEILYSETEERVRKAVRLILGSFIVFIPWILTLTPHLTSLDAWKEVYAFFRNPFPADVSQKFNFLHSTVLHYAALVGSALVGFLYTRSNNAPHARLIRFTLIYAAVAFLFYLRSPNWLRYLIGGELLLFVCAFISVREVLRKKLGIAAVFLLVIVQGIHFVFYSWLPGSEVPFTKAARVQSLIEGSGTIGIINDPVTASLIDSRHKFQVVRISGNTVLGKSPLANAPDELPAYIMIPKSRFDDELNGEFVQPYKDMLARYYQDQSSAQERFYLYKKNL